MNVHEAHATDVRWFLFHAMRIAREKGRTREAWRRAGLQFRGSRTEQAYSLGVEGYLRTARYLAAMEPKPTTPGEVHAAACGFDDAVQALRGVA